MRSSTPPDTPAAHSEPAAANGFMSPTVIGEVRRAPVLGSNAASRKALEVFDINVTHNRPPTRSGLKGVAPGTGKLDLTRPVAAFTWYTLPLVGPATATQTLPEATSMASTGPAKLMA